MPPIIKKIMIENWQTKEGVEFSLNILNGIQSAGEVKSAGRQIDQQIHDWCRIFRHSNYESIHWLQSFDWVL